MGALPLVLLGLAVALFMRSRSEPARLPGEPPWELARGPELAPSREAGPAGEPIAPSAEASADDRAIAVDELGAMLLQDPVKVDAAIRHIESQIGISLDGLRLYVSELEALLPATRQALSAALSESPARMAFAAESFGAAGLVQIAAQLETIGRVHASRSFAPALVALVRDVAENGPPGGLPAETSAPAPVPRGVLQPFTPAPPAPPPEPIPGPPAMNLPPADNLIASDELGAMASTSLPVIGASIERLLSYGLGAAGLAAWATEIGQMPGAQRLSIAVALGSNHAQTIRTAAGQIDGWTWKQTTAQMNTIADVLEAGQLSPMLIVRVRTLAETGQP